MPVTDVSKYETREWFDILLPIFQGDDQYSRIRAAYAFGELLEGRAVGPLMAALDDEEPKVRTIAAAVLGMLRVHRATERLQELCDDVDPDVRDCAEEALENIDCPPEYSMRFTEQQYNRTYDPLREKPSAPISRHAGYRKEIHGRLNDAVNFIVKRDAEMEGRETYGMPILKRCAEMMRELGWEGEESDFMEVAARALKHDECIIRSVGLEILEVSDDPRSNDLLQSNLNDEDLLYRMYTARALARKGVAYPLEPFAACIDEIQVWIPDEAIESLVELDDIRGAGLLIHALQHQRVDIRQQAGEALIALTGEDFGWDLEMWERWWNTQ